MNAERIASVLAATFPGLGGRYLEQTATREGWSSGELSPAVFVRHVEGRERIGRRYDPARLAWCAFDLDGKKHPEGREWALATARRIVRALADLSIAAHVEQSRSGSGFHVWILFDGDGPSLDAARELAAAVLRTLALPDSFSEAAGVPGFYPWPPKAEGCGRVPYLPLHGATNGKASGLFCDPDSGEPFADQLAALESLARTPRAVFDAALDALRTLAPAPVKPERPRVEPRAFSGELSPFAEAALSRESARMASAPESQRHATLYSAARNLGELTAGGELPRGLVESTLAEAATAAGLVGGRTREVESTIRDGIEKGLTNPRRGDPPSERATRSELAGRVSVHGDETPTRDALAPTTNLDAVIGTFRRWLHLPDPRVVYAALGAYAANRPGEDPVWLLIVGTSGSGKTEAVQSLGGLPDVFPASTLTAASLLSGTSKRETAKGAKGGLLREIGDFGIIVCKDFTSVLSLHREARAEVLAALRETYDGSYVRHVGTDGGRSLAWSGRVGFVGGVTPTIDRHAAVMATMGERFLLFRMPEVDRKTLTRKALGHARGAAKMRAELAGAVADLFESVNLEADSPDLTEVETDYLVELADFVTTARSPVERDGYKREIELIGGAEAPTRLALTLARLLGGLRCIGVPKADSWATIHKAGLDCIPAPRLAVLRAIEDGSETSTRDVAERVGYPTITARRTLEDLAAYRLVERGDFGGSKGDMWRKTHGFDLGNCVSEMSEGVQS